MELFASDVTSVEFLVMFLLFGFFVAFITSFFRF